jgi:alpha-beta hydrolase superfamily lysophospholipase
VLALNASGESALSHDPRIQKAFDADPLCYHGKVRARMGYEMLRAGAEARAWLAQLTVPLLVMAGSEDTLVNPSGSELLIKQARSADKTLKVWAGCRHELFNELQKEEVLSFMADWLDAHVRPGKPWSGKDTRP